MRECILEPGKPCQDCSECDTCDLDVTKLCDNCCRCLGEFDYNEVKIEKIILPPEIKLKRKKPNHPQSDHCC